MMTGGKLDGRETTTNLTDQHQIGRFPKRSFRTQSYLGERVFEEQVFTEEQDDAGQDPAAQHDEDTGHGPDSQRIRLVQTVDVRPFQAGNALVPASRRAECHCAVRRAHSKAEAERDFASFSPSDDEPFSLQLVQETVRAVLKDQVRYCLL